MKAIFWSLDGRIGRRAYWAGLATVTAFSIAIGPLQTWMLQAYEWLRDQLVEYNTPGIKAAALAAQGGDGQAGDQLQGAMVRQLVGSVGLGTIWSALVVILALITARAAIAILIKRMRDVGLPGWAVWFMLAPLLLARLSGGPHTPAWIPWGLLLLFAAFVILLGLIPSDGALDSPDLPFTADTGGSVAAPILYVREAPRTTFGRR